MTVFIPFFFLFLGLNFARAEIKTWQRILLKMCSWNEDHTLASYVERQEYRETFY